MDGSEGELVQEIGINQYTEQLMILSDSGVHTQKVIDNTFNYDIIVDDKFLTIQSDEEIRSARLFDGNEAFDINEGIKVKPGSYEIEVISANGKILRKVINISEDVKVNRSILPAILLLSSSITILGLIVLLILKKRKILNLA